MLRIFAIAMLVFIIIGLIFLGYALLKEDEEMDGITPPTIVTEDDATAPLIVPPLAPIDTLTLEENGDDVSVVVDWECEWIMFDNIRCWPTDLDVPLPTPMFTNEIDGKVCYNGYLFDENASGFKCTVSYYIKPPSTTLRPSRISSQSVQEYAYDCVEYCVKNSSWISGVKITRDEFVGNDYYFTGWVLDEDGHRTAIRLRIVLHTIGSRQQTLTIEIR